MKLAITGKGGTGKTTIAGILAHYFNNGGYRVLAVDADPDANLALVIGLTAEETSSIVPISERRQLIKERTGANPEQFGQLFKINPTVKDITDKYGVDIRGIRLLVMGGERKGGNGCACPENVLLKNLLSEIILNRDEVVIVDMEAGIEHLGRATAESIDKLLMVVEPGVHSIHTAQTIMKLARDIGIQNFGIIGNKIQNDQQKLWLKEQFSQDMILGTVCYSEVIQETSLLDRPLIDSMDGQLKTEFDTLFQSLVS
jgi:CO dehydrogenase maturation factor